MVTSPTDICNLALGHLGEARITSLDEDSVSARACTLHYNSVRDEVLRSHRWNFAQDRQVLSALEELPPFGWARQYELPADCLRVLEVNGSEAGDVISSEYIIEGRRILTNAEEVRLVYLRQVPDVSEFDALFVRALAVRLAIVLSETIRGTTQKTSELTQLYERVTAPLARRVDANEGRRRKGMLPLNSPLLRNGSTGSAVLFGAGGGGGALGIRGEPGPQGETGAQGPPGDISEATSAAMAALANAARWTTTLVFFGEAVLNQIFDCYRPEIPATLTAIEVTAQQVPLGGSGLTIQVIDSNGNNAGAPVILPPGNSEVRVVLNPSYDLPANIAVRGKIVGVGSTFAGAGIRVRLSFRPS